MQISKHKKDKTFLRHYVTSEKYLFESQFSVDIFTM